MWVKLVVCYGPCSTVLSPNPPVFLPPQKQTFQIPILPANNEQRKTTLWFTTSSPSFSAKSVMRIRKEISEKKLTIACCGSCNFDFIAQCSNRSPRHIKSKLELLRRANVNFFFRWVFLLQWWEFDVEVVFFSLFWLYVKRSFILSSEASLMPTALLSWITKWKYRDNFSVQKVG